MLKDGLIDAYNNYHMGITAENVAEKWSISREEQDAFSVSSQLKAQEAIKKKKFLEEIIDSLSEDEYRKILLNYVSFNEKYFSSDLPKFYH